MSIELHAAYLVACLVIVVVPGPTVTLIVANSLRHGTRLMGVSAMMISAISDGCYALASSRAGRALSARRVRLLSRLSGGCLIGGGVWLAVSRR